MGRVYEALTRSEEELACAGAAELKRSVRTESGQDENCNEYDFMHYSLNSPSAPELEHLQRDVAKKAGARKAMAQPARQAALNMTRIDPHLVAFYDCDPKADDEYNKLAGSIIGNPRSHELKRLLIASALRGEGRTSVALNLASALGRANKRTLVVDTDLRRPSVLRLLGIEAELGIAEAINQSLPIGAAAINIVSHNFVVLPTRARVEAPAQVLASDVFSEMLHALEPDYDFIIFDSPPLIDSRDSNLLFRLTDAALLVVRAGKTTSGDLGKAIAPLDPKSVLGAVLNRAA